MKINIIGFTLTELLIVIAVVAVLVTVAMPGYKEHITKTRRSDGRTALLDLAARMERYYAEHHTYATAIIGSGNASTDVLSSNKSPGGYYTLSIIRQNANTYMIQAAPDAAQAATDTKCGSLRLDQLGQKSITGTETVTSCW